MNTKKNYIIGYPKSGCTKDQGLMVVNAIRWFLNRYNMQLNDFDDEHEDITITANARQYKDIQCYGQCYEWEADPSKCNYVIDVACDQPLRDMLATIFHECVHLWQWERKLEGIWREGSERSTVRTGR